MKVWSGRQARWSGKVVRQGGHEGMVRQGGRPKNQARWSGKAGGQARHDQAIVRRPRRQIVGPGGGQAGL